MLTVRRILAVLLALAAALLMPVAVWIGGGEQVVLSADTYKDGLRQQNIYPDIIPVALPFLTQAMVQAAARADSPDVPAFPPDLLQTASALSPEAWRSISIALIPSDWLETQTEHVIDGLIGWLNGDSSTLAGTIDTTTLRERTASVEGQQAIAQIIAAAPGCTSEQVTQLDAISQGQDVALPICNPPEKYVPLSNERLTAAFNQLVDHIQNQPPMIQLLAGEGSAQGNAPEGQRAAGLDGLRLLAQAYRKLVSAFYLCPAALLALIVALIVRSFKGFSRWIGWTWIAAGVIALIPLLLLPSIIAENLSASLLDTSAQDPQMQLFLARLTTGLTVSAFNRFSGPVISQAALLILLGVGSLVVAAYLRSRSAATPAVPPISTASARRTATVPLPPDEPKV